MEEPIRRGFCLKKRTLLLFSENIKMLAILHDGWYYILVFLVLVFCLSLFFLCRLEAIIGEHLEYVFVGIGV